MSYSLSKAPLWILILSPHILIISIFGISWSSSWDVSDLIKHRFSYVIVLSVSARPLAYPQPVFFICDLFQIWLQDLEPEVLLKTIKKYLGSLFPVSFFLKNFAFITSSMFLLTGLTLAHLLKIGLCLCCNQFTGVIRTGLVRFLLERLTRPENSQLLVLSRPIVVNSHHM